MKKNGRMPGLLKLFVVSLMFGLAALGAKAQQTTGVACSTSATTTIDGKYVPSPPPDFGGVINLNATDSKPCWPAKIVPPKGAPNVLLIMTDDQGYGVSGHSVASSRLPQWTGSQRWDCVTRSFTPRRSALPRERR